MELKKVKIGLLKAATYNPKDRTSEHAKGIPYLMKSIKQIGLIYPIAVTKDYTVIDGHRRLETCKRLGWKEVPVLIVQAEDKDRVYAEVNANSYPLNGRQNLEIWLKNPKAVTQFLENSLTKLQNEVGRPTMVAVSKAKASVRVIRLAKVISKYVGDERISFVKKTVHWLLKYRANSLIPAYMKLQQPPETLYNVIIQDKALKATYG